jgi:formylglycine-generating enzyme required for sulfatase activity
MQRTVAFWLAITASAVALAAGVAPVSAQGKRDEAAKTAKTAKNSARGKATRGGDPNRVRALSRCPSDMVTVLGRYCVDRYEAYVALMSKGGKLQRHSPFEPIGDGVTNIKALNRRGRMPQAYISQKQAALACANAGKRLCSDDEWVGACKGKKPTTWPYGDEHDPGRCNDTGISSFNLYFGENGREAPQSAYTFENLNDPRLNKPKGTCAPSGRFKRCKNAYKIYDMVGNLHEWTSAPGGTFRGGYFLDVHKHGDGCSYKTTAHSPKYHDYSTGFRCCASLR